MIEFPASLSVKRSMADEEKLQAAARAWIEKEERVEGIHASDLLDPRQALFRLLDPQTNSDREIALFLVGKLLHAFVLGSMEGVVDVTKTDEGSRFSEELGVHYSLDWDKGDIAEFKTTRVFREPKTNEDLRTYLEQMLVYMAAKNKPVAKLWVLYINLRDASTRQTTPAFRAYTVRITKEELDTLRGQLKDVADSIRRASTSGEAEPWRALPLCREWKCSRLRCPWYDKCKPEGRYEPLPEAPEVPRAKKAPERVSDL